MFKIESIKDYLQDKDLYKLIDEIYLITDPLCRYYPKHREWYYQKQIPETLNSNKRNILFIRDEDKNIIAISCLKKDDTEQKLCTVYISQEYRNKGIGKYLIKESMDWLGTTKPFITIAEDNIASFIPFIKKYNWELVEVLTGIYNDFSHELCFNGSLTKNKDEIKEY